MNLWIDKSAPQNVSKAHYYIETEKGLTDIADLHFGTVESLDTAQFHLGVVDQSVIVEDLIAIACLFAIVGGPAEIAGVLEFVEIDTNLKAVVIDIGLKV